MNRKLGRNKAHRDHMLRNLVTSLVLYEQVDTTEAKAKEVKRLTDRIIARSKDDSLTTRRTLHRYFFDDNAVAKIIDELIPRYKERQSGFVKSYHLQNRLGDNAPMMRLELVDKKVFVDSEAASTDKDTAESDNVVVREKTKSTKSQSKKDDKTEVENNG
ncbi:MAG: 50S ribosomal protein L17 [bacterium ADurb.Bin400]|nr:MAG: 50S ribosomal protein L17 [bacterium ADurb.Bin400]